MASIRVEACPFEWMHPTQPARASQVKLGHCLCCQVDKPVEDMVVAVHNLACRAVLCRQLETNCKLWRWYWRAGSSKIVVLQRASSSSSHRLRSTVESLAYRQL